MKQLVIAIATLLLSGPMLFAQGEPLHVVVGVAPHAWLVEQIAPTNTHISPLVAAGIDPHTFEPTARQVRQLYKADLIVCSGIPFEERVYEKLPKTQQAKILRFPRVQCETDNEKEHDHSEEQHFWLSPASLTADAKLCAKQLTGLRPAAASMIAANLKSTLTEIARTTKTISPDLAKLKGERVYTFHPILDVLADEFGFTEVAIETEGKTPSPRQLRKIINQAKDDGARLIITHPQFDKKSAALVANAIGAELIEFDPLARNPLKNIESLTTALTKE
jgi:zinc transport system substrate-binding protein